MNGANYLDMLQSNAVTTIADIPNLMFEQDGAPTHWSMQARVILTPLLGMPELDVEALLLGPPGLQISPLDVFFWG